MAGRHAYSHYSLDCHYRYFLGEQRNGFYVSSGLRFAHIEGYDELTMHPVTLGVEKEIVSDNRIGLAFGIGYRIFGRKGWYWGASLFGGRYFAAEEIYIYQRNSSDDKAFLELELFKIGRMF